VTIRHIAIIGAGLAGVTNAGTLRKAGFTGRISLINGEAHEPYDRPPLSKNILTQNDAIAPTLQEDSWYEDNKIDRQDDQWVSQITSDGRVILKDDSALKPDRIVLATGSRSRRLAQLDNAKIPAFYIREAGDAYALRKRLKPGQHIGIIGAGFIGLEVAASARSLGLDVTVFEAAPRILTRVLTPATSAFISARHRAEGVTLIEATTVINTSPLGTYGARLTINDDTQIDVDILVVGIGSLANDALAVSTGLKTRNGIEVDDLARTSVPETAPTTPVPGAVKNCVANNGSMLANMHSSPHILYLVRRHDTAQYHGFGLTSTTCRFSRLDIPRRKSMWNVESKTAI
jgi:3-phenylpropionate/trans-cinnamate dioxygenase ferredoxin reductase subunit